MYADPKHLKDKETKVRLDEEFDTFLSSLARIHRTQKAVLAREILEAAMLRMREELTADERTA
ncbi:hypothetical protein [Pantoea piersonii]|uniref:hypothetical protein n=1 Tax=Pantoea piersonii TaxID=2364647 RepID=UPI0028AEB311|nr:hypothetical protein [Pantoea piersonii]